MSLRLLLVDDQALLRAGLRRILIDEGFDVVGEASDGSEAVDKAATLAPDVVLMDVQMPVMNGIEATRQITAMPAAPRVLLLTTFDLDEYVYDGLRAGASGFLLKDAPEDMLSAAIRVVADGGSLFAPSVTRRLVQTFTTGEVPSSSQPPAELAALTAREHEVLLLIAEGLSNAEIADRLVLSEHTARTHVGRILTKLDLRDRVQAVVLAYETGLLRPGGPGSPSTAQGT